MIAVGYLCQLVQFPDTLLQFLKRGSMKHTSFIQCPHHKLMSLIMASIMLAAITVPLSAATTSKKRTVRVGYYDLSNFQEYDEETKQYRGYSYDYMLAIAQYANWEYEFVRVPYDTALKMLKEGSIDLVNGLQYTDQLAQQYGYSAISSGESCTCLVISPDNTTVAYEDFASLANLTVGLDYNSTHNSGFIDYCKDNDCMPKLIYYHTNKNVLQGMESGEIDAYLVNNLQDINMRTVAKFNTQLCYFATTKANVDLLQQLNAAMNALEINDPYCAEKIYSKYHGKSAGQVTVISEEERQFIKDNPTITVSFDPSWYPLSYCDNDGNFCGAMRSLFDLIAKETGLSFTYVHGATREDSLTLFDNGTAQIAACFPYDYTWAAKHNAIVTTPFTTLTMFNAYRSGSSPTDICAVTNGSYAAYLSSTIKQEPHTFVYFASPNDCLAAVLEGKANFTSLDSYQLEYYQSRYKYRKLSYKVTTGESFNLSIGVSSSANKNVYTIFSKVLSSIGTDEISNILRQSTEKAKSHSPIDTLYRNPQTAGVLYALLGFLFAILAATSVYMHWVHKKNAELQIATTAKSTFLSNISHDMRTPLNGIIGYTNLAQQTDDRELTQNYLSKIRISGNLLLDLINDTLDISKIESGKYTLNPEILTNVELLESITVPIKETAEQKHINFVVDTLKMKKCMIRIDRLNIQKVVLNLLSNAVKFTPEGGTVTLTISNFKKDGDPINTLISVKDTGIGIGEDFLPKLYEPFSQEHAPEARGTTGTGLGLSIVKAIVTLMNGRIEVKTKRGEGTQFDVYLPIEMVKDTIEAPKHIPVDTTTLAGLKALLCEDNEMNREIAVTILAKFGVSTIQAMNGKEGVQLFTNSAEGTFDVVLMDLRMPDMNGYDAALAIRKLPRADATTVPIIAMSADAYQSDIQKCQAVGMNDHISKPIDQQLLFNELVKFCANRKEQK